MRRLPEEIRLRWLAWPPVVEAANAVRRGFELNGRILSREIEALWNDRSFMNNRSLSDIIAENQFDVCAWCASNVGATGFGEIDHVRPKARVTRYILREGTINDRRVDERILLPRTRLSGYWWLAYDPNNMVFSCERCNSKLKRSLFIVAPHHQEGPFAPPAEGVPEQEILLDPLDPDFDPLEHFSFNPIGEIAAATDQGAATIAVCGLHRTQLTKDRSRICDLADAHARELERRESFERHSYFAQTIEPRLRVSSAHATCYRQALETRLSELGVAFPMNPNAVDVGNS